MKREAGFYWVRINNEWFISEYRANFYGDGIFFFMDEENGLTEEYITEVDEKRITRD